MPRGYSGPAEGSKPPKSWRFPGMPLGFYIGVQGLVGVSLCFSPGKSWSLLAGDLKTDSPVRNQLSKVFNCRLSRNRPREAPNQEPTPRPVWPKNQTVCGSTWKFLTGNNQPLSDFDNPCSRGRWGKVLAPTNHFPCLRKLLTGNNQPVSGFDNPKKRPAKVLEPKSATFSSFDPKKQNFHEPDPGRSSSSNSCGMRSCSWPSSGTSREETKGTPGRLDDPPPTIPWSVPKGPRNVRLASNCRGFLGASRF